MTKSGVQPVPCHTNAGRTRPQPMDLFELCSVTVSNIVTTQPSMTKPHLTSAEKKAITGQTFLRNLLCHHPVYILDTRYTTFSFYEHKNSLCVFMQILSVFKCLKKRLSSGKIIHQK